ncbi:flagellar hook-basal body protein [Fictibacillus phosphorivorans]|uniref:flagellar hook-basal body protein n=1 Tax=Fictibacillus phosphorivorans TaxID=1221500 RepID=UPI00203B4E55|nr:flagellar hook-basal body protein [Fictibacillus phosphorivorans]MCM3718344.1 flagellar hook-basal body protein [Fictibacillus phosphorivorans]MCM3775968.1 flagellar hook-basal body protein [Fictibacillus phosphorivorans]
MNQSMISAAVTMGQIQHKLDTISNNMANSTTNGYKRRETQFFDLLFQQMESKELNPTEAGRLTPNGIRIGSGARVSSTAMSLEPGTLQQTDRALDVALKEPGHYFTIRGTDHNGNPMPLYTRDGAFYLSPSAQNPGYLELVTSEGNQVMGNSGPIMIPEDHQKITIGQNGQVSVTLNSGEVVESGRIGVVNMIRPQLMLSVGHNLQLPEGIPFNQLIEEVDGAGNFVQQGVLESSNVNLSTEMTELIQTQRSYQFNARSLTIADQMMGLVNGLR